VDYLQARAFGAQKNDGNNSQTLHLLLMPLDICKQCCLFHNESLLDEADFFGAFILLD
jgi:hypothetical protein